MHPGHARNRDDPYRVLGVDTSACQRQIGRTHRRVVHGTHPGTRPDEPKATARFEPPTDTYAPPVLLGRQTDQQWRWL